MAEFKIGNRMVGDTHPTYFIADISANHDGSLERAIRLIRAAKLAGADCAKFQHFTAKGIASERGFQQVGKLSHQAGWKESPYQAFDRLAVPFDWTEKLKAACDDVDIEFMSTPYSIEAVQHLGPYVNAWKIGSGDIDYFQLMTTIAETEKPVFLGTGAATLEEVDMAANFLLPPLCIMQCNTNYTASHTNYDYLSLRVIETYLDRYPASVIGLSDHTQLLAPILGAVALGAKVIERHFTDNVEREGPDHPFSMDYFSFKEMVAETRMLEKALGSHDKIVQPNELETVILQRRCLRAAGDFKAGHILAHDDIEVLRPAPVGSLPPFAFTRVVGKTIMRDIEYGDHFREGDFLPPPADSASS